MAACEVNRDLFSLFFLGLGQAWPGPGGLARPKPGVIMVRPGPGFFFPGLDQPFSGPFLAFSAFFS